MVEPIRYPVVQIRPYGLLAYDRVEWPTRKIHEHRADKFVSETGKGQYEGALTPGAKKRLKRAIQTITAIAEPKVAFNPATGKDFNFTLNFITLTLPGPQRNITDREIKKQCLEPFLLQARRWFKLHSYIWRAERQKNGSIHFHLVTDTFIPYDQLRDLWNLKCNNLGFIDRFEQKYGHRHPNSTDVHAIKKVRNLSAYFSKYMAKDAETAEQRMRIPFARQIWHEKLIMAKGVKYKRILTRKESLIEGKVWDCSQNLKMPGNPELILEGEQLQLFQKAVEDMPDQVRTTDQCTIVFIDRSSWRKYIRGPLLAAWQEWCAERKKFSVPVESNHDPESNQAKRQTYSSGKTSEHHQNTIRNQYLN